LFLTPAGAGANWRKASSSRHINIYFDARSFDHADDAVWGPLSGDAVPMLNAGLVGGGPMFDMLAAELSDAHPFGVEAVDSLSRLILVRLARRQVRGAVRTNPLPPALPAQPVPLQLLTPTQWTTISSATWTDVDRVAPIENSAAAAVATAKPDFRAFCVVNFLPVVERDIDARGGSVWTAHVRHDGDAPFSTSAKNLRSDRRWTETCRPHGHGDDSRVRRMTVSYRNR